MRRFEHPMRSAAAFLVVLAAAGCSGDQAGVRDSVLGPARLGESLGLDASSKIFAPEFDPAKFANPVPNAYFPLTPGTTWSYTSETSDGTETNDVEVTSATKTILGVVTTVIHDVVYLDGRLIEDTYDWYAADSEGNVWYLGEDTKAYDELGNVSTAGSWEAGQNGAVAGIIMLADPQKGDRYQQENSPGIVEDRAVVVSLDETVTVPFGTFEHVLQTADSTPIEPGHREYKYYAPGVGLVLEVRRREGGEIVELVSFEKS